MNIYVGNLSPGTTDWQMRKALEMYGKVDKVTIAGKPTDHKSFGFCFVEMPFDNQASRAIRELNGKMLNGNSLIVKESGISI